MRLGLSDPASSTNGRESGARRAGLQRPLTLFSRCCFHDLDTLLYDCSPFPRQPRSLSRCYPNRHLAPSTTSPHSTRPTVLSRCHSNNNHAAFTISSHLTRPTLLSRHAFIFSLFDTSAGRRTITGAFSARAGFLSLLARARARVCIGQTMRDAPWSAAGRWLERLAGWLDGMVDGRPATAVWLWHGECSRTALLAESSNREKYIKLELAS